MEPNYTKREADAAVRSYTIAKDQAIKAIEELFQSANVLLQAYENAALEDPTFKAGLKAVKEEIRKVNKVWNAVR